ncbi:uncharacterized protein L3040_005717 [Drepanopeziza brunnea f. sp. 'multigermtubi']|uniref:uncharacterized protein n=1 Tax=Drepanopeziza brunnea f. sp. 'multigermtubi' TaxID=698441 RepID=UPI0023965AB4|nr:hypothetical protein L3040_005717 [Drepanopeziza brunnea f. sp. 'multigermtubi']
MDIPSAAQGVPSLDYSEAYDSQGKRHGSKSEALVPTLVPAFVAAHHQADALKILGRIMPTVSKNILSLDSRRNSSNKAAHPGKPCPQLSVGTEKRTPVHPYRILAASCLL